MRINVILKNININTTYKYFIIFVHTKYLHIMNEYYMCILYSLIYIN